MFDQIYLIYNINSGNKQGKKFVNKTSEYIINNSIQLIYINMIYLDYHLDKLKEKNKDNKLLFVLAGGDGTVSSCVKKVIDKLSIFKNNIYFSILPLGTRNDFSEYIGKGRNIKEELTHEFVGNYIENIINENILRKFDVWKLENNTTKENMVFMNCCNIGLQGSVVYKFQNKRHNSRIKNIMELFKQSAKELLTHSKQNKSIMVNDTLVPENVEILISNTDQYFGRNISLWKDYKHIKSDGEPERNKTISSSSDQKLEVSYIKNKKEYIKKLLPFFDKKKELRIIGQLENIKIKTNPCFMMIDGESYVVGSDEIQISLYSKINII